MSATWTIEQILALAPDIRTRNMSQRQASPEVWQARGQTAVLVWGVHKNKNPKFQHKTQVDLTEPSFRCTCSAKKRPCAHALGLYMLAADQGPTPKTQTLPSWVSQPSSDTVYVADSKSQQERSRERQAKIEAGMRELGVWLRDLIRNGLADARQYPYSFWDEAAARLVDAEAERIGAIVRDIGGIPATGHSDWPEKLLAQLGKLHLLVEGFARFDTLPPETQADLRTAVGWLPQRTELDNQLRWRDKWIILGRHTRKKEQLNIQHTWLWSQKHQKAALVQDYAIGPQKMNRSLPPGQVIDADIIYYPSAAPLRAIVAERHAPPTALTFAPGYPSIMNAHGRYSDALAVNPWLTVYPYALTRVTPFRKDGNWFIQDQDNVILPIIPHFQQGWHLQALSGGRPLLLFGEWDGTYLNPLTTAAEGRWLQLNTLRGIEKKK